jgi:predicted dehydrogenase
MIFRALLFSLLGVTAIFGDAAGRGQTPIPIAVAGLVHGHIRSAFFPKLALHPEVTLVGIAEPDAALRKKYQDLFHLSPAIFFSSEEEMLEKTHPRAVLVYTSIVDHRAAIETAAARHIAVMVEKPLCTTMEDALAIEQIAKKDQVPILVNYETTWYGSNRAAKDLLDGGKIGELRKVVLHDGHGGPASNHAPPEFLSWLVDPHADGAGALFDMGCYAADLTTGLMQGEEPLTVTAVTQHLQPKVYPHVDDEATIILTYPRAQAIIQASWNWPFARKDMEVYGTSGYVDTLDATHLRERLTGEKAEHAETAPPVTAPEDDSLHYLVAVLLGQIKPDHDLSSLATNLTVMRILDAARRSAATGRTVFLSDPQSHHKESTQAAPNGTLRTAGL